jgi:cell fate regulator YaaT (PSP1 superfamily)
MDKKYKENNGCAGICCKGCGKMDAPLNTFDWLADVPGGYNDFEIVEVTFKNTRKGFFKNSSHIPLQIGDMVAVEANPGHDVGRVSMVGKLVKLQMKRANLRPDLEILRVFRKAKQSDLERYEEAKAKEVDTMIRSRKIAEDLKLNMKIGDVEYQGDGNKAIFYYIADERVDFRQLIKVLADVFKVRIEMKQIGARQEAGRIGGIGPCGRPLCCSSWMSNFVSVATSAARYQDISLNPQKLAGQCAKLKCCMNFEIDSYVEAVKQLPERNVVLETKDNLYYHFKTDIFKREITYSTDKNIAANLVVLSAERVFEVMALNKNGVKPDKLNLDSDERQREYSMYGDIIGQDSVTRFDKNKKKKNNKNRGGRDRRNAERNVEVREEHNNQPQMEGENHRERRREGDMQQRRPRNNNNRRPKGENRNGNDQRNGSNNEKTE